MGRSCRGKERSDWQHLCKIAELAEIYAGSAFLRTPNLELQGSGATELATSHRPSGLLRGFINASRGP